MQQICKNCKHFNPDTFICDRSDCIKLENDWCYGFFAKEKEIKKMTANEMRNLSEEELTNLVEQARNELCRRSIERRNKLLEAFYEAYYALVEDGAYFCVGEYTINSKDDFEIC